MGGCFGILAVQIEEDRFPRSGQLPKLFQKMICDRNGGLRNGEADFPLRVEQTDEVVFASVKRRPSLARRSMLGVFTRSGFAP